MNKSRTNTSNVVEDLSYENGWSETPEIVKKCKELRRNGEHHEYEGKQVYRCVTQHTCRTCGYTYKVDSGD